ncbi:MAG: MIP family channel protein [Dehalococcoidia bacterium]|nr:MIP family channel protein [Dehalococcoidia bacterium]
MPPATVYAYLAEAIGTFGLVFAGAGAVVIDTVTNGGVTHVGISLTFGLIIAAMIYATGHLSGAHFNPSVTLAFAIAGTFPWRQVPFYWAAQIIGAIAAALALRALFGNVAGLGATLPAGSAMQSFLLEIVLAFFLMFVIMAVATDARAVGAQAAIAIGATVALEAVFAGPISGASMNPARSFGPALISGAMAHQWIYWAGPIIGAALGALAYQLVRRASPPA